MLVKISSVFSKKGHLAFLNMLLRAPFSRGAEALPLFGTSKGGSVSVETVL